MKTVGSKMGQCERKPTLRENHVFLALSLGVKVGSTHEKYEHESAPPTWTEDNPVSQWWCDEGVVATMIEAGASELYKFQ